MDEIFCRCPGCGACKAHMNEPKLKATISKLTQERDAAAADRESLWTKTYAALLAESHGMAAERDQARQEAQRLRTAMQRLVRVFPTDGDMQEAGWDPREIEDACNAYDRARVALDTPQAGEQA